MILIDIETAVPPFKSTQGKTTEELIKRMGVKPAVERMINSVSIHSGIMQRHFVVSDASGSNENLFYSSNGNYIKPDTDKRMEQYEKWSKILASEAVKNILANNSVDSKLISRIVTISCTGFFAPGLDFHLINEFSIPNNVSRTNIGFMGCAASIVGFGNLMNFSTENNTGTYTLLLSLELCSLHLQTEPTKDNILANLIFADGCAASLFSNSKSAKGKLKLIATSSFLFKNSKDMMGWKVGNFGFEMMLSTKLPQIILDEAVPQIKSILNQFGINENQVKHWALHPGGRAILDALQEGLDLEDSKMQPSRFVLSNYGNMSSASILFVLNEIIKKQTILSEDICCAIAFGPGLTLEVAIFKGI